MLDGSRGLRGFRLLVLAAAGSLVLSVAGVAAPSAASAATSATAATPASTGTPLYPDLRNLPPRDLRFSDQNISSDPDVTNTHRVLQFSNTAVNVGAGPLEVRGHIDSSLNPPSGPATQRVYDSAGGWTDYPIGTLEYHAVHQHYHFDGWGEYQLWTKSDYDNWLKSGRTTGKPRSVGSKTTSCIIDEEFIQTLPGTPYPARYGGGGCQLDSNGNLVEGLSPGWGDTYDWYRFEQWIDLGPYGTQLADGAYVLRTVADPLNKVYESSAKADGTAEGAADNEATTVFSVSGGQILDSDPPTGTIAINHVADTTPSASVSVDAIGRDDVSGVNAFRLSNDGATWAQYSYTSSGSAPTTVSWSLTDSRYGGTATTGTKTVYAQFRDGANRWGPTTTDTITYGSPPAPSSAYGSAVVGDGAVGYWRLGESSGTTAGDVTGAHPGSYAGAVALGAAGLLPAESDKAVSLAGAGSMRVADGAGLSPSSLSLEAWVRPDALPAAGSFASLVTKAEGYSLQFNGPLLEFTLINSSGTRARLQAPSGAVVVGKTAHVVGTYDGTTARLYVNGAQVASSTSGWAPRTVTNPLVVGSWDGSSEFLRGTVDEVALYPTALTAAKISNHYTTGTGSSSSPQTYPVTVTTSGTGTGTVTSSPAGISCPGTCSASFPASTTVTLTAAPASSSTFSGWTGACTGTSTSCTVSTYAATAVGAVFDATAGTTYGLAVTKGGSGTGTITSSPSGISCGTTCSATYPSGTSVTLTAAASSGSVFAGWAGACAGTTTTCTVSMTGARSVSATFQPASGYALTVSRSGGGSGTVTSSPAGITCGSTCSATFPAGTKVTLTATPAAGSRFFGWSQGCSGSSPTCVLVLNGPTSVTAKFR